MPQPAAVPARVLADLPSTRERRWHPRQRSHAARRSRWPGAAAGAAAWPQAGRRRPQPTEPRCHAVTSHGAAPSRGRHRRLRQHAAGAACRCRLDVTTAEQMKDLGIRRLSDIATARRRGRRRLQRRGLLGLPHACAASSSTTASTTGATACRSAPRPRSRWTTSRASRCSRAPAACRPASARRAAWSTSSSSARPTRRSARPSSAGGRDGSVLGVDRPGRALRRAARVRPAPERGLRAHRPADLRGRRQPLPAGAGRRLARQRRHACSKPRSRTRRRSQPSVPGFSVLGDRRCRQPGNPRINLNNQPWSQPVGVRRHHRLAALARRSSTRNGAGWRRRPRSS